jgi:hypothetical protein
MLRGSSAKLQTNAQRKLVGDMGRLDISLHALFIELLHVLLHEVLLHVILHVLQHV